MHDRLTLIRRTWCPQHYLVLLVMTIVILFLTIILRNWSAVLWFFQTTDSIAETLWFAITLFGGITTLFSPIGASILALFALLVSINAILLWHYIRLQQTLTSTAHKQKTAALSTGTAIAAALGVGCASCGATILVSGLSLFGASGVLLWLPLHGEEFALGGVLGLLCLSWYLLGKLSRPFMCV